MEISAPKEWFGLLEALGEAKGIALLLGATDTGKSTLARFLISHLCRRGFKVGLVDADIGQSFLGPPATIGFSLFKSDPDWELVLSQPEIFFVGSVTPEGHFPIHLQGVKKMVDRASSSGVEITVVDTTGFILGEAGMELKRRKIDLISPQFIVALQRDAEIEPLLKIYQDYPLCKIYRLPLSEQIRSRSMEERKAYRTNRFRDYFRSSVTRELAIEEIRIEGEVRDADGAILPLDWSLRITGLLIGLKDGNDNTLALGTVRNYFEEKKVLRVFTPLREIEGVRALQLSSLRPMLVYEEDQRA
ncbi:MAG: Clp1/GlmU family protein [Thermodesulfobacteriota bacterium]